MGLTKSGEVPSMHSNGREVREYISISKEAMRTQWKCCGDA